jgi:iron-regulated transporter 1
MWIHDTGSYFHHKAFLPSFSGAILYFTVLSFGGQMVTYLLSVGYTATHVGIARTMSVVLEVGATWAAPMLMAKIGPIRSGIWFLNWQLFCLMGAAGLYYGANSSTISAAGLVLGTMLSRVGLWGFDLSAQILVQNVSLSKKTGP